MSDHTERHSGMIAIRCLMRFRAHRVTAWALVLLLIPALAPVNAQALPDNSIAQILEKMQRHDENQKAALKHYNTVRHYRAEYHGYATTLAATMDVAVTYDAPFGKSFRVVAQSGSKLLCDKVLKKAVDSEQEASRDPASTALTPANYRFALDGQETVDGRPAYILKVEPLKESKFLYRGRIWIDAADFALIKFEATPAKNPSFWIARTLIRFSNQKIGDFWLPQLSRSETKVRIGGTAMLVIDYGAYQLLPSIPGPSRPTPENNREGRLN
ncbi:MAG TPA: hypothetical protein VHZ28_04655 [Terracidiphilus sp.]|nr:hypothetical protein [Terracidiphilus sp.]